MRPRLFAVFGVVFLLVYGSANVITGLHGWRWPMPPSPWPFWPSWSAVYLSLDLLLPLTFWKLSLRKLGTLGAALVAASVVAWPLFLLFPLSEISVPATTSSAYRVADQLNLSANYFPSLHVAYALICAAMWNTTWSWSWGAAITFSTLITHQHYTVDVIAGALLAALAVRWATGAGRVESLVLADLTRCAARHRRYALIAVGLYAASLFGFRRRRLARVGFCYLQHLDDLLDGHLASVAEPEEIASSQQRALRGERAFDLADELDLLGAAYRAEMERHQDGLKWTLAVIEEMKLDRRRVRDNLLLEASELDRHLHATFELSLNLMLLGAGSALRASDVPHLVKALAWCSVVRDWDEDQRLGLVNVPREIWPDGLDAWRRQRYLAALQHMDLAEREIAALAGRPGHKLLRTFLRSIRRYAPAEGALTAPGNLKT